jgi:transglutaminase-like putative cysteine protease
MTTQTALLTPAPLFDSGHPAFRAFRRLTPSEGWLTLAILLGSLLVIAKTVTDAAWADTPSLYGIVTVSTIMGLMVAKARGKAIGWHIAVIGLGSAFVYWQLSTVMEATGFPEPFQELNSRLNQWGEAASRGGISTDTIPFALMLASITWIVGYISAWAVFRRHNLWLAVLPGGLAMFSNLSYLPDEFGPLMFLYLAFAMLLAVRIHALNQVTEWHRIGFVFPRKHGLLAVYRGGWYILIALGIAVVLPAYPAQVPWLDAAWEWARTPIGNVEGDLDRLFAALPDRKGGGYRSFGDYLPFQGPISLSDEPLFLLDAPQLTYLRARAYPNYTAQGWTTEDVVELALAGSLAHSQPRTDQSRLEMEYTVAPLFNTISLPVSNLPIGSEGNYNVQVLSASQYWLPLIPNIDRTLDLPDDLTEVMSPLWNAKLYEESSIAQTDVLLRSLPADTIVTELVFQDTVKGGSERAYVVPEAAPGKSAGTLLAALPKDDTVLSWVRVLRLPPDPPDIIAMSSPDVLFAGDGYTLTSSISTATSQELRNAGTSYPGWVTDRYLQTSDDLPIRVSDLAQQLTKGIPNPYDKAKAIEAYLHTLPYDQDIPAPAVDADGVDHFLFVVGRGYSDYYGSAMAVLLREAGVPARMLAGYAPREFDEEAGNYVVREADSHGWAEAYFPGFGWVEFEPTPGWSLPTYSEATLPDIPQSAANDLVDSFDEDEFAEDEGFQPFDPIPEVGGFTTVDGRIIAGVMGSVFTLWLCWYVYRRLFVTITTPAAIFERMCLLGTFAGLPYQRNQTPLEYAHRLAVAFPNAAGDLRILGNSHAVTRYSLRGISPSESEQVGRAWRNVRRLLVHRTLWRNPFKGSSDSAAESRG